MDLAQMLRELWRRKFWLFLGALVAAAVGISSAYKVDVGSLSLEKKGFEFGAASTEILVDSRSSALPKLADAEQVEPFDTLSRRADVYASLLTSPPLKRQIAREAGLGDIKIAARPPVDEGATDQQPSEARANALLNESTGHRLFFDRKNEVPVISVYAEAPSKEEALSLAAGVAPALKDYVARLERENPSPPQQQIRIMKLGDPRGGVVNDGASTTVALLSFFGVFGVACILILAISAVAKDWRREAAMERGDLFWRGSPGRMERPVQPASLSLELDPEDERRRGAGRALERVPNRRAG